MTKALKGYMIFEKNGNGTPLINDKTEAQKYIDDGYSVRIDKAGWGLKKSSKSSKKGKK